MSKIKIGLIDSGINRERLPGVDIVDVPLCRGGIQDDQILHGTVCVYIIDRIENNCRFYNLKIVEDELATSSKKLLEAMEWCIGHEMDIINISISIADLECYYEFKDICDKASSRNCIVVAAANNMGFPCIPASVDGVCGVGVARISDGEYAYDGSRQIQYYANGTNPFYAAVPQIHQSSFATARMSGYIARCMYRTSLREKRTVIDRINSSAITFPFAGPAIDYKEFDFRKNTERLLPVENGVSGKVFREGALFIGSDKENELFGKYRAETCFSNKIHVPDEPEILVSTSICVQRNTIIGTLPCATIEKIISLTGDTGGEIFSLVQPLPEYKANIRYFYPDAPALDRRLSEIPDDHLFRNNKVNYLVYAISAIDTLELELCLVRLLAGKGKAARLLSNSPLAGLFGHTCMQNQAIGRGLSSTYVKYMRELANEKETDAIVMTLRAPRKYPNNCFDKDRIRLASEIISFMPDKILVVIDRFTPDKTIAENIRFLAGLTLAPVANFIFVDFDRYYSREFSKFRIKTTWQQDIENFLRYKRRFIDTLPEKCGDVLDFEKLKGLRIDLNKLNI